MNFVMRKAENRISDPHYRMEIPGGALVVAPEAFFARFGSTFSIPARHELEKDLERNMVFHAIPASDPKKGMTPFVVRQIHKSKITEALAGRLTFDMISPRNHVDELLKAGTGPSVPDMPAAGAQKSLEKPNLFAMTMAQLAAMAVDMKISPGVGKKRLSREELTKAITAKMQQPEEKAGEAGEAEEAEEAEEEAGN